MLRDASRQLGMTKNKIWGGKGVWQGEHRSRKSGNNCPGEGHTEKSGTGFDLK